MWFSQYPLLPHIFPLSEKVSILFFENLFPSSSPSFSPSVFSSYFPAIFSLMRSKRAIWSWPVEYLASFEDMKFKHPEISGFFFFFFFAGNKYWTSCSKEMEEETIFIECWLCTSHNAGSFHIPCFTYAPQQICRAGRAVLWSHFTEGETGLERSQPELTHLDRKKARIQTQEF